MRINNNKMSNGVKKYILIFSAALLLMPFLVLAQNEIAVETSTEATLESNGVTLEDLEITGPGLLPTSNFYFFKEFVRGLRRAVTFNAVSRAELELKIVNEKAAELKKVSENNNNEDAQGLERAVANYKDNVERLRTRLEALKETSENPNIDKLLDKLTDRTIKHIQLFEELKNKHENIKEKLEEAQKGLDGAIVEVPNRLDNLEKFKKRIERASEKQRDKVTKEIRVISVLDRLEDKIKNDEARKKISEVKTEFVRKFETRVKERDVNSQKGDEAYRKKVKDFEKCGPRPGAPGNWVCKDGGWKSVPIELSCAQVYEPVCGVNGKTYGNACEARVAGVIVKSKGECPAAGTRTKNKPAPNIAPTNLLPKTIIPELKVKIPTVEIKDGRFFPSELKIKKGDTVVWTNRDSRSAWPASAIHPTHQAYPGFDALRGLNTGETYSFTFDKVGSWKYHDHLNPSVTGAVVVTE